MKVGDIITEIKRRRDATKDAALDDLMAWIKSKKPDRSEYYARYDEKRNEKKKPMTGVKAIEVTMYKCSDDEVFLSVEKANNHQFKLLRK